MKVENRNYSWHFLIKEEQNVQYESLFSHLDVSCCLPVIQTLCWVLTMDGEQSSCLLLQKF